ncbi:MAG: D-alanyl-D-alanine carboxypeptidase [Clostridia bacterium]|jgi:D-alanyl-D-alanine carboxypeptidase (penicillin-binding protein 5/6)|nr:D-alanyl-D-alanine carboxypeptidase [Clostridia bacterium]
MHINIKYFYKILCILLVFSFIFPSFLFAYDDYYIWSDDSVITSVNSNEVRKIENSSLNLESGGAVLIEQNSGKVLYEHNMHEKLRPASVTKVMTILLIMEALDSGRITLNTPIPCSQNASSMGGSQIWLDVKENLTVHEMLKAICVVSANDCTVAMAEYLAGSEQAFVDQMNVKAKQLGMNNTSFKNCHGIDEDGHFTSSYDIALMSRELLVKHPKITEYTTIWMDSLRDGKSQLVNTNKLIRNYRGATGLKTGSTSVALYNLSASATRDDLSLIAVVMKAPSTKVRFEEAQRLLDYGFNNYSYKEFGKSGDVIKNIIVNKGISSNVNAILSSSSGALVKKGQEKNLVQNVQLEENIIAPVSKGQKLGEIIYSLNDEIVGHCDIIASDNVNKISLWNMTTYLYEIWYKLIR